MSFLNDISKIFGGGIGNIVGGFNIVNMDGKAVYVDGVVKILEISQHCIRLATKHKIVKIQGSDLIVSQSSKDTVIIKGQICTVSSE